ncbi:Tetratricopeptide repeat-containing protein [Thermoactinomyces sp. DSM 45891]|uniref:transcriptional regulator n=1 Tax=Thermoactinomyces sp. DSM 45891 TaxID=1761907 RepID=UPI0009221DAA|nr:transcriptional regulator [Thermoactinomyces sp. DSM 45891]SFX30237.1 Tetratricopeptide repeat-containing protein [Thermoactinomyces sp. DSM 45891]
MVVKEYVSRELGNLIRVKREGRKWTQEKLAFEAKFSPASLSRLEKGATNFNAEKVLEVCHILGIDFENVNEKPVVHNINSIEEALKIIEAEMQESPKSAMEKLRELEETYKHLNEDVPVLSLYGAYLKGKFFNANGSPDEARLHFENAIQIGEINPELTHMNLISACYYRLSRIMNKKNFLQKALAFADKGIKSFIQGGGREYTYYLLYIIKASILEKMKEYGLALKIVEKLWHERSYLMFSDCRLNLYQLRVELFNRMGRYSEAIQVALEGLEFARLESNIDRKFELISSLGEAHTRLGNWQTAERYYELAQQLEDKITIKSLIITTYTNLGEIYLQQNDIGNAERILIPLLKAINLLEEGQEEYRLCKALVLIGEVYQQQRKYKKALKYLEKSLELCEKLCIDDTQENVLVLLTAIAYRSKHTELGKYIEKLYHMRLRRADKVGGEIMFYNEPPED